MSIFDPSVPNLAPNYSNITDQLAQRANLELKSPQWTDVGASVVQRIDKELEKDRDFEKKMAGEGRTKFTPDMANKLSQEVGIPASAFDKAINRYYSEKEFTDLIDNAMLPEGMRQLREGSSASADIGAPIDTSRPIINNPDGSFSTEKTITVGHDGKFYNIPTIIDGKEVTPEEAIAHAKATGQHMGEFDTEAEALKAAQARTQEIGRVRGKEAKSGGLSDYQNAVLMATGEKGRAALAQSTFPKPMTQNGQMRTVTVDDDNGIAREVPIADFMQATQMMNINGGEVRDYLDASKYPPKSYKPTTFKDPRTGEVINVYSSGRTRQVTGPVPKEPGQKMRTQFDQLNAKEQSRIEEAGKQLAQDEVVKDIRKTNAKLGALKELIRVNLPQGVGIIPSRIARFLATESGALAQGDVARSSGSQSYENQVNFYINKATGGGLTEEDAKGFMILLDQVKKASDRVLDKTINQKIKNIRSRDMQDVDPQLFRDVMELTAPTGEVEKGGTVLRRRKKA